MPITPRISEARPYVRPAYEPDTLTLRQLMQMAGESRARTEGQKGQRKAQGLMNLGQIIAQGIGGWRQENEQRDALAMKQRELDRDEQFRRDQLAATQAERDANQAFRERAETQAADAQAYKRGGDVAEEVGYGPMSESQVDPVMQGPAAGRVRYSFGPGTAEGPELQPTRSQQRGIDVEQSINAMGGQIGPNGQVVMPPKPEREPQPTTASLAERAARGDKNAQRALEILQRSRGAATPAPLPEDTTPADPNTQSILGQTGLSYSGFLALTGRMSQLSRDRATRERATREVQQWANSRGVDVSTFGSQYKALNEVVEKNIARFNNTRVAEGELASTLDNLTEAATESGLTPAKAYNAAKLWVKGEFNDPDVQKYAFHLNQLRSELALYNAATQGRSGSSVLAQDFDEASRVLQQGIAAGSLTGLKTAIERSVQKMGTVLEGSVDRANKDVWTLFGVGDRYQSRIPKRDGGGNSVTTPDGQVFQFPTAEAAAQFRRQIGGGQ